MAVVELFNLKPFALKLILLLSLLSFLSSAAFSQRVVKTSVGEEGWARNQINAVIFRRDSLATFRDRQFVAYYDGGGAVVIGERNSTGKIWKLTKTSFTGNVKDAHNSVSLAIDGDGFLHLTFDHHNSPLSYARSLKPLTPEFGDLGPMTGADEKRVTYPEFYNLPDGGLIFMYRDGASGNGRLILDRYDVKTGKWTRVQTGLIDGEGKRSAYTQATVDARGAIHLSWVWRDSPDVASNHDLCYARSDDGGKTWKRSDGSVYELPITLANAEFAARIPQKSDLINQTSMTTDGRGHPVIATYWRTEGETSPQYRVVRFDGAAWQTSVVTSRTTPFSLAGGGTKRIPISRPLVVADGRRTIVVFRDEERGSRVSVAVSKDFHKWKITDLGTTDVGMWEPTMDSSLWRTKRKLSLFVQKVGQGDGERLEDLGAQKVEVWEILKF